MRFCSFGFDAGGRISVTLLPEDIEGFSHFVTSMMLRLLRLERCRVGLAPLEAPPLHGDTNLLNESKP